MPRPKANIKSHLPANEVKICLRVREARLALGLSQQEFSGQVGIGRERLASYEDARVPLKTSLALQMCNQFIISERWLATGKGYFGDHESEIVPFSQPMARMCMGLINAAEPINTGENLLFSAAYKAALETKYLAYWDQVGLFPRIKISPSDNLGRLRNILQYITSSWIGMGGEAQKKRLFYGLIRSGYLLADEIARGQAGALLISFETKIEEIGKKAYAKSPMIADLFGCDYELHMNATSQSVCKDSLDNIGQPVNLASMKSEVPTWPELKKDIKKMTQERGAKKALADQIGVSRQVLGNWLSNDAQGAPNADLTLELLKRVQQWKCNK